MLEEYEQQPDVVARVQAGGPVLRPNSNDPFEVDGVVAKKIFDKNKKDHTFYLEQSTPITWMYPYLLPSGLIFKFNPEPMATLPASAIEDDYKFWDAYGARLLNDPRFRIDPHAILSFSKLAFWHADLYSWRHLQRDEEHWLRLSIALCPQFQDAVDRLARLLLEQKRYDEGVAVVKQAELDDPRNDFYPAVLTTLEDARIFGQREEEMRGQLAKSPYDVQLNLDFARLLQEEGKYPELNDRLRTVAGLTNWSHEAMAGVVQYYVDTAQNPDAAIAFLEARAQIDPTSGELIYSLAALHARMGHKDEALKYLGQAVAAGGTNALMSARIDPRLASLRDDPRFQALFNSAAGAAPHNPPGTNPPAATPAKKPGK